MNSLRKYFLIILFFINVALSFVMVYQVSVVDGQDKIVYKDTLGEKHQKTIGGNMVTARYFDNKIGADDSKIVKEKEVKLDLGSLCQLKHNLTQLEYCTSMGTVRTLESLSGEEAAKFYTDMLMTIPKPKTFNFVVADEETQLEVVLFEMKNSESKFLVPTIYNIVNVYANEKVAFTIVHHAYHAPILEAVKKDFKNLRLIQLAEGDYSIEQYSDLLSSPKLWNKLKAKFTLITQTDVVITKPLKKEFYQYDLIGAPWPHNPCASKDENHQVGNGGYSLRNTTKMKMVIEKEQNRDGEAEDVWWCNRVENVPTVEIAKEFAVELYSIENVLPTAGHKMWAYRAAFNSAGEFFRLFQKMNNIKIWVDVEKPVVVEEDVKVDVPSCRCEGEGKKTPQEFCMRSGNVTLLESLSADEAKDFYTRMMLGIRKPKSPEFVVADEKTQLEIVLIELKNSESKFLVPAIYNIANVYAHEQVAFTIVHHAFHAPVLTALKDHFKNLRLIQLTQEDFSIKQYSELLSSTKFWNNFKAKFTLITQPDVMIVKPLKKEFYQYDLIGAPWTNNLCVTKDKDHQVGSGGYTLRNTATMKKVAATEHNEKGIVPEDVWWCKKVKNLPTVEIAKEFAVEMHPIGDNLPTAGHKVWDWREAFNSAGQFFRYFQQVNSINVC
jgi:Protein of unknown function (DUF5672)